MSKVLGFIIIGLLLYFLDYEIVGIVKAVKMRKKNKENIEKEVKEE